MVVLLDYTRSDGMQYDDQMQDILDAAYCNTGLNITYLIPSFSVSLAGETLSRFTTNRRIVIITGEAEDVDQLVKAATKKFEKISKRKGVTT
jgi:hypothetical protein